ncbi:hypothetical protein F4819DRAFT_59699 [Hypoxylon fuscum]|nr:hypothetical protein F4819DRAFT_59699 [Hypoxylon fuscum]
MRIFFTLILGYLGFPHVQCPAEQSGIHLSLRILFLFLSTSFFILGSYIPQRNSFCLFLRGGKVLNKVRGRYGDGTARSSYIAG